MEPLGSSKENTTLKVKPDAKGLLKAAVTAGMKQPESIMTSGFGITELTST